MYNLPLTGPAKQMPMRAVGGQLQSIIQILSACPNSFPLPRSESICLTRLGYSTYRRDELLMYNREDHCYKPWQVQRMQRAIGEARRCFFHSRTRSSSRKATERISTTDTVTDITFGWVAQLNWMQGSYLSAGANLVFTPDKARTKEPVSLLSI
jgi:hypothetical protein